MPALRGVPPGRTGILWLRHHLDVAGRGADLLQRKVAILTEEARRLRELVGQTAGEWDRLAREADRWLTRAALLGGDRAIRLAALTPAAEAELTWVNVMGVRYPTEPRCELPDRPPDAPGPGNAAVVQAEAAYRAAVPAAVRHAVTAAALRVVETELATTRQRVRALERNWIPRLAKALAAARQQMEEQEHGDAVRARRASTR